MPMLFREEDLNSLCLTYLYLILNDGFAPNIKVLISPDLFLGILKGEISNQGKDSEIPICHDISEKRGLQPFS